jgi:hypothetical protein
MLPKFGGPNGRILSPQETHRPKQSDNIPKLNEYLLNTLLASDLRVM